MLSAQSLFASFLGSVGRTAEAEKLSRRALRLLETKLGLEHPETAAGRTSLAEVLQVKGGHNDEMQTLLHHAVQTLEASLGPGTTGRSRAPKPWRASCSWSAASRQRRSTCAGGRSQAQSQPLGQSTQPPSQACAHWEHCKKAKEIWMRQNRFTAEPCRAWRRALAAGIRLLLSPPVTLRQCCESETSLPKLRNSLVALC